MLNKIRKKINKDVIAVGMIVLISIVLYGKYIAAPFGDFDTWFERIAYGGYDFRQLPEPLQKLDIPVTLKQYAEYREKVVGRLFGSVLPTYAMAELFGERVLGWRIVLYLVMFATFWLLYSILKKLQMTYWHRVFCLLFFVILLNRYFFKPISIIIGLSHLFFLIAMLLELNNSGLKDFRWRYSILGSLFVFLSLFIRELSATSVPALLAVLLFWQHEKEGIAIRFKWNWRRLAPYAIFAAIYAGLYLRMSARKIDFAYSNMISWQIDPAYLKRVFLLLLKWFGLESSLYLGFFILLVSGLIFLLTLVKSGYLPGRVALFKIFFGIMLLTPTLLLIPFLKHGTGSFTLQYLSGMIICSFLIGYMDESKISRKYKKISHVLLSIVFASLWLIYALEARQKAENFCVEAGVTQDTVNWVANNLPKNRIMELKGFNLTSAYSFVADVFIAGRHDPVRYIMSMTDNDEYKERYIEYLKEPFIGNDQTKLMADMMIEKTLLMDSAGEDKKITEPGMKVFLRPINKYSIGYFLKDRSGGRTGGMNRFGAGANFVAKFIFGVRLATLEKQLPTGVGLRIQRGGSGPGIGQ